MRKQIGEALLLASVLGGAYGGYKLGESINSETPEAVASAQASYDQAKADYIAMGSMACEQGALSALTVSSSNYYAAPKSADTTAAAVSTACSDLGVENAMQLGDEASNYYVNTVDPAMAEFNRTKANSEYTLAEKLALTAGPVNIIIVGSYIGTWAIGAVPQRIREIKKQQQGGVITSEDLRV